MYENVTSYALLGLHCDCWYGLIIDEVASVFFSYARPGVVQSFHSPPYLANSSFLALPSRL